MVVTSLSATDHNGVSQAATARSPIMTLQAPHSLAPQPKCGPVMPSGPRKVASSEESGSASIFVELLPGHRHRYRALLGPEFDDVRPLDRGGHGRVQLVDDRFWRAGGRH